MQWVWITGPKDLYGVATFGPKCTARSWAVQSVKLGSWTHENLGRAMLRKQRSGAYAYEALLFSHIIEPL